MRLQGGSEQVLEADFEKMKVNSIYFF